MTCLGCRVCYVIVRCPKLIREDKTGHEKLPMFLRSQRPRGRKEQSCSAREIKMGARVKTWLAGKGFTQDFSWQSDLRLHNVIAEHGKGSIEGSLQVFEFSEAFLTLQELSSSAESGQEPCRHKSQDKGCDAHDSCTVQDDSFCVTVWFRPSVRSYRTQN